MRPRFRRSSAHQPEVPIRTSLPVFVLALAVALTPATAIGGDSFFDIFTDYEVFTGPPYPTQRHQGNIAHVVTGSPLDGHLLFGVAQCKNASNGNDLPIDFRAGDGAPRLQFSVDSFFDIDYRVDLGGPQFAVDSFFDVFFDLTLFDGTHAHLVPRNPALPPTDPAASSTSATAIRSSTSSTTSSSIPAWCTSCT